MARSRLQRTRSRQSKHSVFMMTLGTIILLVLIVMYGIPALVNLSLIVEKTKGINSSSSSTQDSYIAPPELNAMSGATNSASIVVTGLADPKYMVKLYVNGKNIGKTLVKTNKSFIFRHVPLEEGDNIIKAKLQTEDKKESAFSEPLTIIYSKDPPKLDITSPQNDQKFSGSNNTARVSGSTDENVKITVNGYWAVIDGNGNFSYNLPLQSGETNILIIAVNESGNKTEKEVKITYDP